MSHPRVSALIALLERIESSQSKKSHPHSRAIVGEVRSLTQAAQGLASMFGNPDPYETAAKNDKKVADSSRKLSQRVDTALDRWNQIFQAGSIDLDMRVNEKANLKAGPYDTEIRQVFRSMSTKDRAAFLSKSLKDADAATLSALLLAPPSVTTLDPEMVSQLRESYIAKVAPDEIAERDALMQDMDTAMTMIGVARKLSTELLNPAKLREAEAAEQLAKNAQAKFDSALNPV